MIGLKGVVVKSHGSADALAFHHALKKAYAEVAHGVEHAELACCCVGFLGVCEERGTGTCFGE